MYLLFLLSVIAACNAVEFEITNNLPGPIWVGILGNPGHQPLQGGGFNLNSGRTMVVGAPANWAGRFWARTWCNVNGNNHCATGDCGNRLQCVGRGGEPPVTLVEFTLKGNVQRNQDFYDISLVDGFNVRASIQPVNGYGDCRRLGCDSDLNRNCPADLQVLYRGNIVGCKSNCLRYTQDKFCCTGQYKHQDTCKPTTWPTNLPNSAKYFKNGCPQAYSYAYDDRSSTFTCFNPTRYKITFA